MYSSRITKILTEPEQQPPVIDHPSPSAEVDSKENDAGDDDASGEHDEQRVEESDRSLLDNLDDIDEVDEYDEMDIKLYMSNSSQFASPKFAHLIPTIPPVPMLPTEALPSIATTPPAGKLYRCIHCKEAFTTSYMLANHVSRRHPKLPKPPKPPKRKSSASTVDSTGNPVKRKPGRPPKNPKPNDNSTPTTMNPPNITLPIAGSFSFPVAPNADTHINQFTTMPFSSQSDELNKASKMKRMKFEDSGDARTHGNGGSEEVNHKGVMSTETLAQKVENLSMLRKACDQGLISEAQYQLKQEEFLRSISFQ
jgi:hypothetical protein